MSRGKTKHERELERRLARCTAINKTLTAFLELADFKVAKVEAQIVKLQSRMRECDKYAGAMERGLARVEVASMRVMANGTRVDSA